MQPKHFILAVCATMALYCGHAATTSPIPDARAQGDGGVCEVHCPEPPPRCIQCQTITTYHMILDQDGLGTLQLGDPDNTIVQVWIYDIDGVPSLVNRIRIEDGVLVIIPYAVNAGSTARITIMHPTEG